MGLFEDRGIRCGLELDLRSEDGRRDRSIGTE